MCRVHTGFIPDPTYINLIYEEICQFHILYVSW